MGPLYGIFIGEHSIWVHLFEIGYSNNSFSLVGKVGSKNMAARRVATNTYRERNAPALQAHLAYKVDALASGGKKSKGTMFQLWLQVQ